MVAKGLVALLIFLAGVTAGTAFAAPPEQITPDLTGWTVTLSQAPAAPLYGETVVLYQGFSRQRGLPYALCVRGANNGYTNQARTQGGFFVSGAWKYVPAYTTSLSATIPSQRISGGSVFGQPAISVVYWINYFHFAIPAAGRTDCVNYRPAIYTLSQGNLLRTQSTTFRPFTQTNADFSVAGSPASQRAGFPSQVVATVTNSAPAGNYCYWAEFTNADTDLSLGYGTNSRSVRIIAGQNSSFTLANQVSTTSASRTIRVEIKRALVPTTQVRCPLISVAAVARPRPVTLGTREVELAWVYDQPTASDELTVTYTPLNPDLTQTVTFSAVVANSAAGTGVKHCYYVDVLDPDLPANTTAGFVIASGGSHTFTLTFDPPGNPATKELRFQAVRLNAAVESRLNAGDRCPKDGRQGSDLTGIKTINVSWRNAPAAALADDNACPPCFGASSSLYIDGAPEFILNDTGDYTITIKWQPLRLPSLVDWDGIVSVGYGYSVTGGKDENGDGADDAQPSNVRLNNTFGTISFDYAGDYRYNNGRRDFLVWARAQVDPSGDGYPAKRHQADFEFVPAGAYIYTSPTRQSFVLPAHGSGELPENGETAEGSEVDISTVPAQIAERENVDPRFVDAGNRMAMDVGRIVTDLGGGYTDNPALSAAENNAAYLDQVETTATVGYLALMLAVSAGVAGGGSKRATGRVMHPVAAGVFAIMVIPGGLLGWLLLGLYGWQPVAGIMVILFMAGLIIGIGKFRRGF